MPSFVFHCYLVVVTRLSVVKVGGLSKCALDEALQDVQAPAESSLAGPASSSNLFSRRGCQLCDHAEAVQRRLPCKSNRQ